MVAVLSDSLLVLGSGGLIINLILWSYNLIVSWFEISLHYLATQFVWI